jgi:hypothetical protein
LLSRPATDENVVFDHNLYWNASGPVDFNGLTLDQWQKLPGGKGEGSIVADPMFVDPAAGDFHLKPGSPAPKIGFKPFDYTQAGVYGDPAWIKLAASAEYPKVELADPPPPLPPLEFRDDCEGSPPGSEPANAAHTYHGGKGNEAYARVIAGMGAGGSDHCIKLQDAPDLDFFYNPHFFYTPRHTAGTSRLAFDFRIEPDAMWFTEWRNDASPYRTGPHLSVAGGKLTAPGVEPVELPVGEWVHVEMTTSLGPDSNGTWQLAVTLPGREPIRFDNLKYVHPEFRQLHWLGFCSTANQKTAFYLDNIELTNTKAQE